MSTENIQRILAASLDRIPAIRTEDDQMAVLRTFMVDLARDTAEHLHLKVNSEPGWTAETAGALADHIVHEKLIAITDSVHQYGGSIEMAEALVEASVNAFGERLRELAAGWGEGGRA